MKNLVQVIRKKTPYRIENWVCNVSSFGIIFGYVFFPKLDERNPGTIL